MGDPQYMKYPDLTLAQSVFTLASPSSSSSAKQTSLKSLQNAIKEHKMAPLYYYLAHPQTGKLNPSGESSASGGSSQPPSLRRTTSTNSSSIVGMLGGVTSTSGADLSWDEKLYEELKADNEKELEAIQKEEDEATEKAGESEIQNARGKRAEFYARVGDKVRFMTATDTRRC